MALLPTFPKARLKLLKSLKNIERLRKLEVVVLGMLNRQVFKAFSIKNPNKLYALK